MSNKNIVVYKENIFTRIRRFFNKLFSKNNVIIDEEKKINKIEFFDGIRFDSDSIDKVIDREQFLKEIEGNVENLNLLSLDRLKKLEKYYDSIIEKNEMKIKKLKS